MATREAGNAFLDLSCKLHILHLNLRVPISKQTAVRLLYHFENGRLSDWHYSGLERSTLVGNRIFLDASPQNYHGDIFGA